MGRKVTRAQNRRMFFVDTSSILRNRNPWSIQHGIIALRNHVCGMIAPSVQPGYQDWNNNRSIIYRLGEMCLGEEIAVAMRPAMYNG